MGRREENLGKSPQANNKPAYAHIYTLSSQGRESRSDSKLSLLTGTHPEVAK